MLDLIFVALFQAAAGPAEAPSAEPVAEQSSQTSQQAASTPAAAQQEERLICHREPILGSRLFRRVCLTADENQQIDDETRDQVRRMQSQLPLQGN